jgi:hypothetical protein
VPHTGPTIFVSEDDLLSLSTWAASSSAEDDLSQMPPTQAPAQAQVSSTSLTPHRLAANERGGTLGGREGSSGSAAAHAQGNARDGANVHAGVPTSSTTGSSRFGVAMASNSPPPPPTGPKVWAQGGSGNESAGQLPRRRAFTPMPPHCSGIGPGSMGQRTARAPQSVTHLHQSNTRSSVGAWMAIGPDGVAAGSTVGGWGGGGAGVDAHGGRNGAAGQKLSGALELRT